MKTVHVVLKSYITTVFLLLLPIYCMGQTYYYEQIKIVNSDKSQKNGSRKGQFITFNSKGCYDSDNKGFTVNNGFLEYVKIEKGIRTYYGDSFWGKAYYLVAADFNRINVKLADNTILVYAKSDAPNYVTTSFYKSKSEGTPTYIPVYSNSSQTNSTIQTKSKLYRKECSFCNKTGVNPNKEYGPDYTGGKVVTIEYCTVCRQSSQKHYHNKCPSCGGSGYTESYNKY